MNNTTILAGLPARSPPEAIILAAGTRIAAPPALSTEGVPVGSSVLVTVTRGERRERTAREIEHEPRGTGEGSRTAGAAASRGRLIPFPRRRAATVDRRPSAPVAA